jgi:hypothetical protein
MTSVPKMLLRLRNATLCCVLLAGVAAGQAPAPAPEPGAARLRIDITVLDENGVPVPNARITSAETRSEQVRLTETDSAGRLRLMLAPGTYRFTVDRTGFYTFTTPEVDPAVNNAIEISIHHHQSVGESITVSDVAPGVDPQQTSRSDTLDSRDIVNIPYPTTRDVRNVLAYMPGLVQERATNQVHIAGAAAYQTGYVLDGFTINQPAVGTFELRISPDAVRRIDVESSRYSAQYGRASGGVMQLDTRTGDDHYRFSFVNFVPTFQTRHGIALNNWVPRATFGGPLKKGRAWFYLSQDAELDNTIVKELPDGADRNLLWRVGDLARVQFNLTPGNVLSSEFVWNYLESPRSDISRFTPLSATTDQQHNTFHWNIRDQVTLPHKALLDVGFAISHFRDSVLPQGTADFIVNPLTVGGNFFRSSLDRSQRVQGVASLYLPPVQWAGRHDIRVGIDESGVRFYESATRHPTLVFDTHNLLTRKITFVNEPAFRVDNVESGVWAQDRWAPFERLVIEAGLRADRDQIVPHTNISPRVAGAYTIGKTQTKVSAGVGLFYDETRLNFITRPNQGQRLDFFYAADGVTQLGAPAVTQFVVNRSTLESPRFLNWSLGLERMLPGAIYGKFEFVDRHGAHGFTFVNQSANPAGPGGDFLLTNRRADHYDGFTVTLRREFKKNHVILGSYTRSSARTNQALEFTLDNPIFGRQQRGPLPWDAPNRFISWGWLPLSWMPTHFLKTSDFAYSLEYRTGFAYNLVNNQQALVGAPDRTRFPYYLTVNPAIEHVFQFFGYQFALRGGVDNVTGNKNPAFVINNVESPLFGTFSGTGHRTFNGRLRFLGKK